MIERTLAVWSLVPLPFSKSSLNIWKFMVHVLLKPDLEDFEYYFASMWDDCNCAVVWTFFGIALLWDWNKNWPFPVLWPLLSFPNLLAYWVQLLPALQLERSRRCEWCQRDRGQWQRDLYPKSEWELCAVLTWTHPTPCSLLDCSSRSSSVLGVFQAVFLLAWVAISSPRGSSWCRNWTYISSLLHWQMGSLPLEPPGNVELKK